MTPSHANVQKKSHSTFGHPVLQSSANILYDRRALKRKCHLTMTWTHLSYWYDQATRQVRSSNKGFQTFLRRRNLWVSFSIRERLAAHFAVGLRNVTKHLRVVGLRTGSWARDVPVGIGSSTYSILTINLLEMTKVSSSVNKFIALWRYPLYYPTKQAFSLSVSEGPRENSFYVEYNSITE
jgi:hypothetical protein